MVIINVADSSRRYTPQTINETMETPRSIMDKLGINYSRAQVSMDGTLLTPGQMDMTFAALGVTTSAFLNAVVKGDGAAIAVTVTDSSRRYGTYTIDETADTPRSLMERLGVNYSRSQVSLNGTLIAPGFMDSTFAELGVTTNAVLSAIVKGDGAAK